MLCRDCFFEGLSFCNKFQRSSRRPYNRYLFCPPHSYKKIHYNKTHVLDVFAFSFYIKSLKGWLCSDADHEWYMLYAREYNEIFNEFLLNPTRDDLILLYSKVDLFCKSRDGLSFFGFAPCSWSILYRHQFTKCYRWGLVKKWWKHYPRIIDELGIKDEKTEMDMIIHYPKKRQYKLQRRNRK